MTHTHGAPPPPAPPQAVPAWRLIVTLGGTGALAGLLIVVGYTNSLPRIEANKSAALARAVTEVLKSPARYDTLYLVDSALVRRLPDARDPRTVPAIYVGFDSIGATIGYAIFGAGPGFSDQISLIFGYNPSSKRILAMKVLGQKDTPGLGDKIEKDTAYTSQFNRIKAPLVPVKQGTAKPGDSTNVQTITGATITSKAVIRIMNAAIARWEPLIASRAPAAAPRTAASAAAGPSAGSARPVKNRGTQQ